jgi:hypothetical protein
LLILLLLLWRSAPSFLHTLGHHIPHIDSGFFRRLWLRRGPKGYAAVAAAILLLSL